MSTIEQDRTIYAKLEAMKDVRSKTIHLEKMKLKIIREVENGDAEEKCLAEYRREMEMLLQEKMSHVEELRQIHADINAMESVIKQAEENRLRALNVANRLHDDYIPLKAEVDHMRREYLGLERLPELHEEEGSIITPDRFQNFYSGKLGHGTGTSSFSRPPLTTHAITANQEQTTTPNSGGGNSGNTGSSISSVGGGGNPSQFLAPTPVNPIRSAAGPLQSINAGSQSKPDLTANRLPQTHAINIGHPTFRSEFLRQQPPPMKSCLSCHQQIHRNAPICPLCKAKSRSRNPKKPKKKEQ